MTGQFQGLEHDNRKGRSFFREATAYRYLLHEGVCAAGVVPYCYGYTVIHPTGVCYPPDTMEDVEETRLVRG